MSATALESLLTLPVLTAVFKKGQTMLGNHWRLFGPDGQEVGRTRRVYDGVGGKVGKRLAVVTGLSTAGSVTIEVLDAASTVVGSVFGKGGDRTTATLSDANGPTIGSATHEFEVAALARNPHAFRGSSIIGDLVFDFVSEANWETELLRHYGFRRSNSYTVALLEGADPEDRLRMLVVMLPVLAGHLY
jgi:hypothetical protein